jgi:hypothetical protein
MYQPTACTKRGGSLNQTPVNLVAAFYRWDSGCWNYPNQSLTGSEFEFGGIADYGQEYPCPNGLGLSERKLSESPAWRRRIAKARRDAEDWSATIALRDMAAQITIDEIQHDIEEIRTWANSLRKVDL